MGAIFASHIGDLGPSDPRFPAAFMGGFGDALVAGGVVAIAGGLIAAVAVRR